MQIQIQEAIRGVFNKLFNEMEGCVAGRVINADDINNGFIQVQPLINRVGRGFETTERPVIGNVPIVTLSTTTSAITPAVKRGDTVLLIFTKSNHDNFKLGIDIPHDLTSFSKYDLDHAVAILGFPTTLTTPFKSDRYTTPLNHDSFQITNNIGSSSENAVELKGDGGVEIRGVDNVDITAENTSIHSDLITLDAPETKGKTIECDDIIIRGIGSVKEHILTHIHPYTDDGNPMQTGVAI